MVVSPYPVFFWPGFRHSVRILNLHMDTGAINTPGFILDRLELGMQFYDGGFKMRFEFMILSFCALTFQCHSVNHFFRA